MRQFGIYDIRKFFAGKIGEPPSNEELENFHEFFVKEFGEDFTFNDIRIRVYMRLGQLIDVMERRIAFDTLDGNFALEFIDMETCRRAFSGADLETALAAKDAELEQARAEMSALREENAALNEELERARQEKGQGDAPEWYGLIAVVEQCRKEGKKPQETAAELKKAGASLAVIGGLLHPNGGISDWRQYGKNLLEGGTKYLPW